MFLHFCRISTKLTSLWRKQGRNDGGQGGTIPRAPDHWGGAKCLLVARKSPNNFTGTFFNTVNFLPKGLRFERGGAKLASRPGRHLTSLHPWAESLRSCTKTAHLRSECLVLLVQGTMPTAGCVHYRIYLCRVHAKTKRYAGVGFCN